MNQDQKYHNACMHDWNNMNEWMSSSSSSSRSKSNAANSEMTKANNNISLIPIHHSYNTTNTSPDNSVKNEKKKKVLLLYTLSFFLCNFPHALHCYWAFFFCVKSILPKIFGSKRNGRGSDEDALKSNTEGDSISISFGIYYTSYFLIPI